MSKKMLQAAAGNAGGDGALYVDDVFSTYLYEGNATARTITNGIDLSGEGGLVWTKFRASSPSALNENHYLFDTETTTSFPNKWLATNSTEAAATGTGSHVTSFNSDGWSMGAAYHINQSGLTFASWTFRKAEKFFDVVTYTGTGSAGLTIPHNLGSAPAVMFVKSTSQSSNWYVYHISTGNEGVLLLNTTNSVFTGQSDAWNSTTPTDSNFQLGNAVAVNTSGQTYVAYLFASDAGGFGDDGDESIIKCGTFSGGIQDVDLGFEPQFLLYKRTDSTGSWGIFDVMRGMTADGVGEYLHANTSNAEATGTDQPSPIANGFRWNYSPTGETYIYIAIRRPMKTPESGTEVFAADLGGSTAPDPWFNSGFPVDMNIVVGPSNVAGLGGWYWANRFVFGKTLDSSDTSAENSQGNANFDYMTGAWDTNANTSYFSWMFKRATGFFDVVAYTGNVTANRQLAHNLGAVPELMIAKTRDAANYWVTYDAASGPTKHMILNQSNGTQTSIDHWYNTTPTASFVTLGDGNYTNRNATKQILYLFATLAGVSKVGSYTGTAADLNVDCGFSAGARFILIKRTDSTGDWFVWDSVRGIVAGNDPYILLNSTAAEVTSTDYIDPLASGFTVTSSAPAALNDSGGSYIFLAIA